MFLKIRQETRNDNHKRRYGPPGSSITNHLMHENHLIDWESGKIIEKERGEQARGIKDVVHNRTLPIMNRNEGRFHLPHLYDDLLGAVR